MFFTTVNPVGYPSGFGGGNACLVIQCNYNDKTYSSQIAIGFWSNKIAMRNRDITTNGSHNWTAWKYLTFS